MCMKVDFSLQKYGQFVDLLQIFCSYPRSFRHFSEFSKMGKEKFTLPSYCDKLYDIGIYRIGGQLYGYSHA